MSKIQSLRNTITRTISSFTLTTPLAIIIAALILGGSHVVYGIVTSGTVKKETALFSGRPVDNTDYIDGTTENDVYVVEYSDPECPYCVTLHPTMKQIRDTYRDKIAFVYRHFPLTEIHPNAFDESKAIACAGKLNGNIGFYTYIDTLYGFKFSNQTTQLPKNGKDDIATNGGLDKVLFEKCMKDDSTGLIVDASLSDGVQAGVRGTPSTFVLKKTKKGYEVIAMIDGARDETYFKAAIEEALSR